MTLTFETAFAARARFGLTSASPARLAATFAWRFDRFDTGAPRLFGVFFSPDLVMRSRERLRESERGQVKSPRKFARTRTAHTTHTPVAQRAIDGYGTRRHRLAGTSARLERRKQQRHESCGRCDRTQRVHQ